MYEEDMKAAERPRLAIELLAKVGTLASDIYDRVSDLERRLENVLEPDQPAPGVNGQDRSETGMQSPLVNELGHVTLTLNRVEARLAGIAARLQI